MVNSTLSHKDVNVLVGRLTLHFLGADPDALATMSIEQWEAEAKGAGLPAPDPITKQLVVHNFRSIRIPDEPEVVIKALPEDPLPF
jgi:hypothetical protein